MSEDWTEKYRPASLSDVVGNPAAVEEIRAWARSWDEGVPRKRALTISGPPGVGKTTSALALARDMGWGVVEMNASDQRTGDAVKRVALRGAGSDTFDDSGAFLRASDGGRKLIILDEADNLFGREDRGALPAIVELIRTTGQPVVLIVNDLYALTRKSSAIKNETVLVPFKRPVASTIHRALAAVAAAEGVSAGDLTLRKIADNSNGDIRAAVRDLESQAMGRESLTPDTLELSERIVRKDMYDLMGLMFRKSDATGSRELAMNTDETPEQMLLWIDENLPHEYADHGDLVRGYEKLARADVFLGRVHRRQHYRFWAYARDVMTAGVVTAKRTRGVGRERFRFPSYLMKMSRSKGVRATKAAVCMKLAVHMHTSTSRVADDVLPYLKIMLKNDAGLRRRLVSEMDLDPEELAFLTDEKIDSPAVKAAFSAQAPVREEPEEEPLAEPAVKPPAPKVQRSLFEF
ncbi:MAG: replication factor C large subunit [Candidatus Methanomethylophilaceae archaeon]|jgi:replication factor C large subunit|nr:replication factor C large subunit [Candidatus Methanomethylophilaceae archaeon]NLF33981.1 replication factor C large subunit [Thermoplasmatales archaeon]